MVLFNHATREMTAKIVYYGPGLCGKTTNLMVIFDKLDPKSKGKMLSLSTKTDRTLFFDLLPVDIGKVGPFNLKIQLYTVPGQVFYNETRKLVLRGADSVVFVADSQPQMIEANRESFANLLENLEENQIDPNDTPIVVQFNKRDLPGVMSVEELQEQLGFEGYPYTEASALRAEGVMETFRLVSKITAKHLFARLKGGKTEPPRRQPVGAATEASGSSPNGEVSVVADVENVPFPDASPVSDYEAAQEVSLEELLAEGRTRPATIPGEVPVPVIAELEGDDVDEVEELSTEQLVVDVVTPDPPVEAVPVMLPEDAVAADEQLAALKAQVAALESRLAIKRQALESLLTEMDDLRARIAAQLD